MKKLLLPLIILLLIIGYFMSRDRGDSAKDAYDSLKTPESEQMTPPDDRSPNEGSMPREESTPPDTNMPRESDQPDTTPPGNDTGDRIMDRAEDATSDTGDALGGAADRAGSAAQGASDAAKKAAEEAKRAAEEAAEKLRGEDTGEEDPSAEEEPQGN